MPKPKPAPLRERDITRQIAREYYKEFDQLIESDVIIVGAGPSGLICAHDLAEMGKPGPRWDGADPAPLERILFHLVQEYARHLGHLDIVAELANGQIGE